MLSVLISSLLLFVIGSVSLGNNFLDIDTSSSPLSLFSDADWSFLWATQFFTLLSGGVFIFSTAAFFISVKLTVLIRQVVVKVTHDAIKEVEGAIANWKMG